MASSKAPSVPGLIGTHSSANGGIAGAHRVDGNKAAAVALELGQGNLERIGVMVLGGTDHHEQLGAVQVRAAEFPEGTADGIDHASGHVHGTETAVGGIVGSTKLTGEEAGKGLHLVASGKESELLRVFGANPAQPLFHDAEGLVPGNGFELGVAALRALLAQQRLGQAGGRILFHDAAGTLGANHALVQRVIGVALDVTHLAVLERDADAATAGTHVASGVLYLNTIRGVL